MRVGAELRGFVLEAWRDRNPSLSEPESRKLIAEVRGVSVKAVESILRHADGGAPKGHEQERKHEPHKRAGVAPAVLRRKTRGPPPLTDRESAILLCVAQRLVEGRDDEGSIHRTDRGRHVLAVLERYAQ